MGERIVVDLKDLVLISEAIVGDDIHKSYVNRFVGISRYLYNIESDSLNINYTFLVKLKRGGVTVEVFKIIHNKNGYRVDRINFTGNTIFSLIAKQTKPQLDWFVNLPEVKSRSQNVLFIIKFENNREAVLYSRGEDKYGLCLNGLVYNQDFEYLKDILNYIAEIYIYDGSYKSELVDSFFSKNDKNIYEIKPDIDVDFPSVNEFIDILYGNLVKANVYFSDIKDSRIDNIINDVKKLIGAPPSKTNVPEMTNPFDEPASGVDTKTSSDTPPQYSDIFGNIPRGSGTSQSEDESSSEGEIFIHGEPESTEKNPEQENFLDVLKGLLEKFEKEKDVTENEKEIIKRVLSSLYLDVLNIYFRSKISQVFFKEYIIDDSYKEVNKVLDIKPNNTNPFKDIISKIKGSRGYSKNISEQEKVKKLKELKNKIKDISDNMEKLFKDFDGKK